MISQFLQQHRKSIILLKKSIIVGLCELPKNIVKLKNVYGGVGNFHKLSFEFIAIYILCCQFETITSIFRHSI